MECQLAHHGILGMKWGIRRTPEQLGHAPAKPKKKLSGLSDEELRQRINRLNMEEQYSNLVSRQKERNRGALSKFASKALEQIADKGLSYAINKAAERLFPADRDEMSIKSLKDADLDTLSLKELTALATMYKNRDSINSARNPKQEQPKDPTNDWTLENTRDLDPRSLTPEKLKTLATMYESKSKIDKVRDGK